MKKVLNFFKKRIEKCTNHPETEALNICKGCKQHFCEECLVEGTRYYYCKSKKCKDLYYQEIDYSKNPRFCPKCISETTDETAGDLVSVNYILGDKFINEVHEECPVCGSVINEKIGNFGSHKMSYKVIWLNKDKSEFISRKLK